MLIMRRLLLVVPAILLTRTACAQPGPGLNVLDFQCFLTKYAQGDGYANCDGSTVEPTLNALDFSCFMRRFAAGEVYADCTGNTFEPGWTDLGTPELTFYVAADGNDANGGLTEATAVRSIARARALARDGHRDWVLFRRGDTWTTGLDWQKSAGPGPNGQVQYMVIGAYGPLTSPRPKFRTAQGVNGISLGTANKAGLAFVHLDLEPSTRGGSNYSGVSIFGGWSHILIEGCRIAWFPGNFVIQDPAQTHITMDDIRIRRCTITNSYDTGPGHSQGIFLRDTSNWVIEECLLDANALNKADIFCHNVYVNEGCGAGIFKGNISARACSHGVQQRPGGTMENNTFLQNPIAVYQGKSAYVPVPMNTFRWNVAIDSRDINQSNPRAIAFELGDADLIACEHNIAANQTTGNGLFTTYAFSFEPANTAVIRGNVADGWGSNPESCNAAMLAFFNGGFGQVQVFENRFNATRKGQVIVHATPYSSRFTYHDNRYFTTNGPPPCYSPFDIAPGNGGDFTFWRVFTGDTGSAFGPQAAVNLSVSAYMTSIGRTGGLSEFLAEVAEQRIGNWRRDFTADGFNDWARAIENVEPN